MTKTLYRKFRVESKKTPYSRGQNVYNQYPLHGLEINVLINVRSQEQALFCPPFGFNQLVINRLKLNGFMSSYNLGKHNKYGDLVKRFDVHSFYHYTKDCVRARFGSIPVDQPVFNFRDMRHGITLEFEGKYYSAEVRYGWAYFKTDTHNVTMKLVENKWTFKSIDTIDLNVDDLPF